MPISDLWHYPRRKLAKEFVVQLDVGLTPRLTLAAPRRKGKTEFLIYDLAPVAEKSGYRVVYMSLWANVNAPHLGLLEPLTIAVHAKRKRMSITRTVMTTAINKVKIDALGIGAELEFAKSPQPAAVDQIGNIDRLIDELSSGRRTKLLLILDEIQHLGTDKAFLPLVYALRTTFDRLRKVRVVFSGSSRGGIRRMFGDQSAPFFGFSTEIELPDLDRDFTRFLSRTFKKVTQRNVDADEIWDQFQKLDRNPYYVREGLKLMAIEPDLAMSAAVERVLAAVAEQNDYVGLWAQLPELDRALFLTIAREPGGSGLHGQASMDRLSKELGRPVSRTLVGRRLRRLVEQNFLSTTRRGVYQIELPGFAEWATSRET